MDILNKLYEMKSGEGVCVRQSKGDTECQKHQKE